MWKESYRIGIDAIDRQHMALFQMVEDLLESIQDGADKEKVKKAVEFLKNYASVHFRDEEAYQESIHYAGIEMHKRLHWGFTKAVADYEKRLIEKDYAMPVVKDLAGMLTSWLIFHVADADQKIAEWRDMEESEDAKIYATFFTHSVMKVLSKMAGLNKEKMRREEIPALEGKDRVFVEVGITGNKQGAAVYGFSRDFALKLIKAMTFMDVKQVDELVCSALAEISNISSGNAATRITQKGYECNIRVPLVHMEASENYRKLRGVRVLTEIGAVDVAVRISNA